ncbi:MAG: DMT family transporter [Cyanobacteria bacterium P01_H01_bin.15]
MQSPAQRGYWYSLAAGFWFGAMGYLIHRASNTFPTSEIVLARALSNAVLLLPWVPWRPLKQWRWSPAIGFLGVRAIAGACSLYCLFWTLGRTSVGNARILGELTPLFVAGFAWIVFGETLTKWQQGGLMLTILGTLWLSWSSPESLPNEVLAVGIVGAFMAGIALLSLRQAAPYFSPALIVFLFNCAVLVLVFVIPSPPWHSPQGLEWALLGGVGLSGLFAQLLMTRAFALITAALVTGTKRSSLAFGVLFDWLGDGDQPTGVALFSYGLVMLGVWGLTPNPEQAKKKTLPANKPSQG